MKQNSSAILYCAFLMTIVIIKPILTEIFQPSIKSKDDFCLVVPADYKTSIGTSESTGMTVWCGGTEAKYKGRKFKGNFWSSVTVTENHEKKYIQMTGCINLSACDRLDPRDQGGQYDNNGDFIGVPSNSFCSNDQIYKAYVQLIEPANNRACIRCCKNAEDCPTNNDRSGCMKAIPGKSV
ncbi:secreted protein [Phakopsora pachyrhizi]|nr:secreted protein [Phakopsora pachyrhizi]